MERPDLGSNCQILTADILIKYINIGPVKQIFFCKIAIIYLSINLNMCFVVLKTTVLLRRFFEYLQHMFWLRNI